MACHDPVFHGFLQAQREQGMALAEDSDVVDLEPLNADAAVTIYLANYHCTGLVQRAGKVVECYDFLVGICFPDDYLRCFDTARVVSWCHPADVWHPNIRPPFMCLGRMRPGTPLVDLLYQIYEIITYQNVEMREHNALNPLACNWARRHPELFPVNRIPLRRRRRLEEG